MDETRSKSWKTLRLAPAAFMTTVYKLDSPDTDDPTANGTVNQEMHVEDSIKHLLLNLLPVKLYRMKDVRDPGVIEPLMVRVAP